MKKIRLLLFVIFIIFTTSCEEPLGVKYAIHVRNNSAKVIHYYAEYILPDIMLPINKPSWLKEVASGGIKEFYDSAVNDKKIERLKSGERITLYYFR